MSIIDTIDTFDKLEYNDVRSFAAASALIAKSIQAYNDDPAANISKLQLLYNSEYDTTSTFIILNFSHLIIDQPTSHYNRKI